MKKLTLTVVICVLSISAFSQTSTTKTEKIRKLLEISGSSKLGEQVFKNMSTVFQQSFPKLDNKFWEDFAKEVNTEDLANMIIPIYNKYYTEADIDELIKFYNTPTGKKVIQTLPLIMQESMVAGQAWGKQISEKVMQKIKNTEN